MKLATFAALALITISVTGCATRPPMFDQNGNITPDGITAVSGAPGVGALGCEEYSGSVKLYNNHGFPQPVSFHAKQDVMGGNRYIIGGRMVCQVENDYSYSNNLFVKPIEKGSINGVPVQVDHSTGTVKAGDWEGSCHTDKMDGTKLCSLSSGNILYVLFENGEDYISVVGDHYPGTESEIRINSTLYSTADQEGTFSKAIGRKIYEKMSDHSTMLTRYTVWPEKTRKITEIKMAGFDAANTVLKSMALKSFGGY
ncbi:hypothetical protein RFC90_003842 [Klebsiella aerogenes]|nr:hypothetical protein [Klebsiella aerogenes]